MTTLLIASRFNRHDAIAAVLEASGHRVIRVRTPGELAGGEWQAQQPEYLFFTHWSHRIPAEIHERHECVIFHMADLPKGRGGSPVQNLIAAGHEHTTLCALRCVEAMDAGPVYLRRPVCLAGTVDEILDRAAQLMAPMILEIVDKHVQAVSQDGEPTFFRRRTRQDGNLASVQEVKRAYDFIRMLDGEGYPPAFLETDGLLFEFSRASLKDEHILADVRITRKT